MNPGEAAIQFVDFMNKGGDVMWLIALLSLLLWSLIFERVWYLSIGIKKEFSKARLSWSERQDKQSKLARHIQNAAMAKLDQKINLNINLIKTLILLCPLLGLLGTVTGMIAVFDVISFTNMSDVKLMASGVSKATIPTMASMVVAISGIFAHAYIRKKADAGRQGIQQNFNGEQDA
jgi:biopolymer transport protein ExbB